MKPEVKLKLKASRYGHQTESVAVVRKGVWPVDVAEWIWPAMIALEAQSELQPPNKTKWEALSHAIPNLARLKSWKRFKEVPIGELEVEDVRDFFIDLDAAFHFFWGGNVGALRSSTLRGFILEYLRSQRPDEKLARVKGSFRPKTRSYTKHRHLIDDAIEIRDGKAIAPPIGALPHQTPQELKSATRKRLTATLERIQTACLRELDDFEFSCQVVRELRDAPVDEATEKRALQKLDGSKKLAKGILDGFTPEECDALISFYLRKDYQQDATFEASGYFGSSQLEEDLSLRMGLSPIPFIRCSRYEYYPLQNTLIAAVALLQIATAWNVASVLQLTANGIKRLSGGGYLIQSLKPKTQDDTPQVLLEGDDNPGVIAIRFLLSRLEGLRSRGWVSPNEACLWLSPRSNYKSRKGQPISNIAKGFQLLINKHDLPKFSSEQLRVQTLTVISIERGPIQAAEMAGHSTFSTIGGYIDHLITQRINSSINLEFQKRWEQEVLARITQKEIQHPLVPIGDGASCVNPRMPPKSDWLAGEICQAGHCHAGTGCPNRVLIIDRARIEEVNLIADFYQKNWQSLYAGNPKQFAEFHIPRIEFNFRKRLANTP